MTTHRPRTCASSTLGPPPAHEAGQEPMTRLKKSLKRTGFTAFDARRATRRRLADRYERGIRTELEMLASLALGFIESRRASQVIAPPVGRRPIVETRVNGRWECK
jgi:hypothetical protein